MRALLHRAVGYRAVENKETLGNVNIGARLTNIRFMRSPGRGFTAAVL